MKSVASDPGGLVDRVVRAGHNYHLTQVRTRLDIPCFLKQVGADPSGGFADELGDIQHAKSLRPQTRG